MHFRISFNKQTLKHKNSLGTAQDQPHFEYAETDRDFRFKLPTEDNCYNLSNLQTLRESRKPRIELPPITKKNKTGTLQNFHPIEIPLNSIKRKPDSIFRTNPVQTFRAHYQTNKLAASAKSTTNESETKSLSGGEQVNHEEWDTLPIRGTSTTKMSSTNITQNEVTHHHGLKHRSTEKCLIGHSKRLPFSLEKKKPSKRPSQGMGCQDRKEQPMSEIPFQLNLSGIIYKRESKQFLDDQTEKTLKQWC